MTRQNKKEEQMKHSYETMRNGYIRILSSPRVAQIITGVSKCTQSKDGTITLTYSDGSIETRKADQDVYDFGGLINIVSFVQEGRSK